MRTARARVSSSNFPSAPMAPVSLLDRSLSHTQGDSKARRAALQMLRAQIISAPEELRDQVRNLTRMQLIRTCAAWRPDVSDAADAVTATRIALKSLARRILDLGDEISMLDELITPLVTDLAPRLLERPGIGIESAAQRARVRDALRRRAAARLVRADPTAPAQPRGDRQANRALHLAVISRLRMDPQTKAYVAKRTALGHSKLETIRCLKRYLAREVYYLLNPGQPPTAAKRIKTAA